MGRKKTGADSGGFEAVWMPKLLQNIYTYLGNCSRGNRFLGSFVTSLPNYSGDSIFSKYL